jgi:uncharacterized protein
MVTDPDQHQPEPEQTPSPALPIEPPPFDPLTAEPPSFFSAPPPLPPLNPPTGPRPWRFWATFGLGAAVLGAWGLAQVIVVLVILFSSGMISQLRGAYTTEAEMEAFKIQFMSRVFAPATVISCPVGLAMCWFFVRIRRLPVLEYLGLVRPRIKPLLFSLGAMLAVVMGMDYLSSLAGVKRGDEDMVKIIAEAPSMTLSCIALVVAAPLFEEILFRGFLFRGFSISIGPILTVLLTSLIFAALHTQYNIVGILMVFSAGATMGCTRWWTGSTTITILQHAMMNGIAAVQVFSHPS